MSSPRERFEAYLRGQVEGCTNEQARAMGRAYREAMRDMMQGLYRECLGHLTVGDAVAVLTLGEYLQPADERVRRGMEALKALKGEPRLCAVVPFAAEEEPMSEHRANANWPDLTWTRHAGALIATQGGVEYGVSLQPPYIATWPGHVESFDKLWQAFHACERQALAVYTGAAFKS